MRKALIAAAALLAAPFAARAASEFSVVVQGGGVQYNQALSGQTDLGVAYGARVGVMPTPIVGFEIGYLGTQNNVRQTLATSGDAERLVTNGAAADLRINVLPGSITPYVFGGYGLTRVSVSNQSIQSPFRGETVSTIPFGGGVEANAGAFKIGARFQYNHLMGDGFYSPAAEVNDRKSDFYGVSVDLGASFR
jgi:hypothetical protein